MRTVSDEVIRIIASNREWMKKYPIVKAIVMNPKTPLALSLNLFKRLIDLDLKMLILGQERRGDPAPGSEALPHQPRRAIDLVLVRWPPLHDKSI